MNPHGADEDATISRTMVSAPVAPAVSALIVEVPEAEGAIGPWRREMDELAPAGVPPHVTCLFPFPLADDLAGGELDQIARAAASVNRFDYRFSQCAWFGDSVLWLAPDDPQPFLQLTRSLTLAFPHLLPYEGRFDSVIPHLTVGHKCPSEQLRNAEQAIGPRLPVQGRATALSLFSPTASRWECTARFELT